MKKILLSIIAVSLSLSAFSQVEWGVKAGLNLADISNIDKIFEEGSPSSKMKPSFHIGAFADIRLNDFLSFQPELMYSRQGSFFKAGDEKLWIQFNYINLPLILKLYVTEDLSVNVGPQFGFVTDAKEKYKFDGSTETEDYDAYEDLDVSVAMGLSYNICRNIDVYARYNLGLTAMNSNGKDEVKLKNGVIQIGVGYRF